MVAETGIYITWVTGAILISIAMMPIFKPPFARISADGFIDMFRRYWAHMVVVFSVYLWKDILDGLDRILMANTQLDMTPYVYAIEGDIALWIQEGFRNPLLALQKSACGASEIRKRCCKKSASGASENSPAALQNLRLRRFT